MSVCSGGAGAVVETSQNSYFVVVLGIFATGQMRRRGGGAELCRVLEGRDGGYPGSHHRYRHRRCSGKEGRRTPLAQASATVEGLRVGREAPVADSQVEDAHGGLLAYERPCVPREAEAGEIAVIDRDEVPVCVGKRLTSTS
jgi:hypothetical protein